MEITVKVKRCNPQGNADCKPSWQSYDIKAEVGMSVLEVLLDVIAGVDPSLVCRRSCRSAICGSCAMKINGRPLLACDTQIIEEYEKAGKIELEPLDNHRVIKDLAVFQEPLWDKFDKIIPYLNEKDKDVAMTAEDEHAIDASQKCIMCGSCNSVCNALEMEKNYLGPAALAKAWRFVGDVREGKKEKRLDRLSQEHGIWDCVRCVHCTEYCPKDVAPLSAIERLRDKAMAYGIDDNHGAKHSTAMVDSIRRVGRLDEAAMTFKTLGLLRSIGMIPFGMKMEMHGKMPHPVVLPAIDGIDEVRKIMDKREEEKKKEELD